jgi:hypothetical protein
MRIKSNLVNKILTFLVALLSLSTAQAGKCVCLFKYLYKDSNALIWKFQTVVNSNCLDVSGSDPSAASCGGAVGFDPIDMNSKIRGIFNAYCKDQTGYLNYAQKTAVTNFYPPTALYSCEYVKNN